MRIGMLLVMFGLLGAGTLWVNSIQSRAIPGTGGAASPAPAAAASPGSVTAPAPNPAADMEFAGGAQTLQLRPDQTAIARVKVLLKKKEPVKPANSSAGNGDNKKDKLAEVAVPVKFYFDMQDPDGRNACTATVVPLIGEPSLTPGDALDIPLTITSCNPKGGKGTLFIVGNKSQHLEVTLEQRNSCPLFLAMLGTLIFAVLLCAACAKIVSSEGHKLGDAMSQIAWDFSSSWASNIALFGGAFTFITSLSLFPDRPLFAPRGEYQFIAAFAAALAALAPAVHRFTSSTTIVQSADGPVVKPVGFVGGFLTASVFTIWGSLLQGAVALLVVCELKKTGTVYPPIIVMVGIFVAITLLLLVAYSWKTLLSTIAANATRTGPPSKTPRAAFMVAAPDRNTVTERKVAVL